MVVFTCNNCGETLQKPRVAKHYQFQCRTTPNVTCVDCLKDFHGQEYIQHTKCISEAERYGGKNYVPKPGAGKGEKKQQEWLNTVNSLLNTASDLSPAERNFLQSLTKYENIPRKKTKFQNFVRCALGSRVNSSVVDSVWAKMEANQQKNLEKTKELQNNNNLNGHSKSESAKVNYNEENNITENQNNENICKENGHEESHINSTHLESSEKKKKSKKRSSVAITDAEETTPIKKNKTEMKEDINLSEDLAERVIFDWKSIIINKISTKGEISLKKLRKHVFTQYKTYYPNAELDEKFLKRFNKKLNKISEITISEERARLM